MVYITKPPWIRHSGKAILSADIHPSGEYIATCGIDCKVKIWSTESILEEKDVQDDDMEAAQKERIVGTITLPYVVNSVRWSKSGALLAIGADHETVSIYKKIKEGEEGRYVRLHQGRGHAGDVMCVEWSDDDRYLASASIDNTVRIWDLEKEFQCVGVLEGHSNYVNGIAWDPVMQYIATQSDDKTVRVWRVNGWKLEAELEYLNNGGHFKQVPSEMYYFRRLSWSPDGRYLATPHGFKQGYHVAFLIKRNKWTPHVDLVGHTNSVVVASFNPKVFHTKDETGVENETGKYFSVIACGGLDSRVTIWSSVSNRPLAVFNSITNRTITDISWDRNGTSMCISSLDGSIVYVKLQLDEIHGEPLDTEKQKSKLRETHSYTMSHLAGNMEPLEGISEMEMEEEAKKVRTASVGALPKDEEKKKISNRLGSTTSSSGFSNPSTYEGAVVHTLIPKRKQSKRLSSTQSSADRQAKVPEAVESPTKRVKLETQISDAIPEDVGARKVFIAPQGTGDEARASPSGVKLGVSSSLFSEVLKYQITLLRNENGAGVRRVVSCENLKLPMEIRQSSTSLPFSKCKVTVRDDESGEVAWIDYLPYKASSVTGTAYFVAVACNPVGALYTFSLSGIRLNPPIIIGEEILLLKSLEDILLCLTRSGKIKVWKLRTFSHFNPFSEPSIGVPATRSSLMYSISVQPLINFEKEKTKKKVLNELEVLSIDLIACEGFDSKEEGGAEVVTPRSGKFLNILMTFSNNSKYMWNNNLKEWVSHGKGDFYASDYFYSNAVLGSIPFLSTKHDVSVPDAPEGSTGMRLTYLSKLNSEEQERLSFAHLENMLAICRDQGDSERLKYWLLIYIKKLTGSSDTFKLTEILNFLLWVREESSPNEFILDLDALQLFNEVLRIISSNRSLQRLSHQFHSRMKNQELMKQSFEFQN